MTDIAIRPLERTELPPSRVGEVKPPLSLADKSGEIGLAFAAAQFAGDRFNDVVNAKAANEHAEFQGIAAAEMEAFDTFVVSKPGASFEELESERNKMVARIEAAGKKATTRSAQQSNKNWMLLNKSNIHNQTQTSMEAIRTRQALAAFNVHRKNLITKFKENELTDLYAGQVKSRLMTKEFAAAQLASDLAIIGEAEKKIQLEQAKVGLETRIFQIAAEQGYEAAEAKLRDPSTTARLIEAGVRREDVKSLITDVSERAKHEKVVADEKIEAQREVDRAEIYDAINIGEFKLPDGSTSTDIRKFIERSSLDEDEQEAMWQKSIKETERKLKGEDIITKSRIRSNFYRDIPLMLSGAITRDELLDRANNARFGTFVNGKYAEPVLSDPDYKAVVNSVNAQYEQGYGQMMSKVNDYAEGILLKTDSLGFVENAPVRYKQMGDFQQAWFDFVASKGDKLKLSDIYPEGRRLAATFQISDEEAQRQEEIVDVELKAKEAAKAAKAKTRTAGERVAEEFLKTRPLETTTFKKLTPKIARRYLDIAGNNVEEAKRLAAEDGYRE